MKYLSKEGLTYLITKFKSIFATKEELENLEYDNLKNKPSTFTPSPHTHEGTSTTGTYTTHSTPHGTIQLGPMNTTYNHIYSTLSAPFYMYHDLLVAGGKQVWHAGNSNVITDSGSNANGRYIKFSDGNLIMMVTSTTTLAYAKAVTATVTLPSSAINANYQVMLSYAYDLPDAIRGKTTVHARNKTTSSFQIIMQTQDNFFNSTNVADVRIDCVIYARWK